MQKVIDAAVAALPGRIGQFVMPRHAVLLAQMVQFGMVGTIGFAVDTGFVYLLRDAAGLYIAGALAYAGAVTTTWWLNRIWTFRGRGAATPVHWQWVRFVAANIPGLILNLGSYFTLVAVSTICTLYPVIAVAAGAVAGMTANFILARTMVFQ